MSEIKENEVYTLEEAQALLKVSRSTMMRQIKNGILRAGKFGGQYRILGSELLRLLLPSKVTDKLEEQYDKFVDWVKEEDK